jgi:hypothetical protein
MNTFLHNFQLDNFNRESARAFHPGTGDVSAELLVRARKALDISNGRKAVPLAERTRAALASLTAERGGAPA